MTLKQQLATVLTENDEIKRENAKLQNKLKLARLATEEVLDWGLTAPTHWRDYDKTRFDQDVARCRKFFDGLKANVKDEPWR